MAKRLNVLIGCEESGTVREAFRALGHNAWSCDLVPARDGSPYHLREDVRAAIKRGACQWDGQNLRPVGKWDLGIFHPPCTYLCNSGVRWFTTIPANPAPGVIYGEPRRAAMVEAAELFADLLTCEIPGIAVENPVMHKHGRRALAEALRARGVTDGNLAELGAEFDQSIQPYEFGDPQLKRTCLWLRNLPALQIDPAEVLEPPPAGSEARKLWSSVHRESPGKDRAKIRSTSWAGIARAMAWQWGGDARGGA